MALHASAVTSAPTAGGSKIQYTAKITHEQLWLRVATIPSTIQFRLTHSSPAADPAVVSAVDIGESQFCHENDHKAYEFVSQLLSSSPLATLMEDEEREAMTWEIVDTTLEFIGENSIDGTRGIISKIWIVSVEIEQSSRSSSNSSSEEEDGERDEVVEEQNDAGLKEEDGERDEVVEEQNDAGLKEEDGERDDEVEEQNDAGLEEEEKEDETSSSKCAICCKGIPMTWSNDYCPDQNCPSRRSDVPTLRLLVVC